MAHNRVAPFHSPVVRSGISGISGMGGRPIARGGKFGNESCPVSGRADPVMTRRSHRPGLAQGPWRPQSLGLFRVMSTKGSLCSYPSYQG